MLLSTWEERGRRRDGTGVGRRGRHLPYARGSLGLPACWRRIGSRDCPFIFPWQAFASMCSRVTLRPLSACRAYLSGHCGNPSGGRQHASHVGCGKAWEGDGCGAGGAGTLRHRSFLSSANFTSREARGCAGVKVKVKENMNRSRWARPTCTHDAAPVVAPAVAWTGVL